MNPLWPLLRRILWGRAGGLENPGTLLHYAAGLVLVAIAVAAVVHFVLS